MQDGLYDLRSLVLLTQLAMNMNNFHVDQLLTRLILEFKRKRVPPDFDDLLSYYKTKTFLYGNDLYR